MTISSSVINRNEPTVVSPTSSPRSSLRSNNSSSTGNSSSSSSKSVSFAIGHNKAFLIEQIEELDAEKLWYNSDEFFEIKLRQRMDAKTWRRSGLSVLLNSTYKDPDDDAQEYLNAYCQLEEPRSRRGLERHLCRKHGEERSDCKDRARLSVLLLQERLDRQGWSDDAIAEELSDRYHEICKEATLFAHRIAKADEHAAREGSCDDAADAILLEHNALMFGGGGNGNKSRRLSRRRSSGASLGSVDSCDSFRLPLGFNASMMHARPCRPKAPPSPALSEDYFKTMSCLH